MAKTYKGGQFVSIGGTLCRVSKKHKEPCEEKCLIRGSNSLCEHTLECLQKLGYYRYPIKTERKR